MRVRDLPLRETTHDLLEAVGVATMLTLAGILFLFALRFAGVLP